MLIIEKKKIKSQSQIDNAISEWTRSPNRVRTYHAIFSDRAALTDLFFLLAGRCVVRIDLHVWKDYYRGYAWNSVFAAAKNDRACLP